ncbi:MAG: hypothetical protein ACYTG2_05130 [Planctomycetota bacterium]|jgi:hypothetical protein
MTLRRLLTALALPVLLASAGELHAQERVLLRRYADVVVVRADVGGQEEVLYYFDPTRELAQGAQIQQGSGGFSELLLSGGAKIASHASAQLVLERLAPEGDIVRIPMLNLLEVFGGTRKLQLVLPGGTRCLLLESKLLIEMLPGRLRIRNQKGEPVSVTGLVGVSPPGSGEESPEPGQGRVLVTAGQEIQIPMYAGEQPGAGMSTRRWAGRLVRIAPGADVAPDGARLRVEREAEGLLHETANVEVGGVATMPGGGRLVIHDPRPMADTTPPQQLVPPTGAAPSDAPAGGQVDSTRGSTEEESP